MAEFIDFESPYIDKGTMEDLISIASGLKNFDKAGGNSKCNIIEDYAVLKAGNIPVWGQDATNFSNVITTLNQLKQEGINVVPILGYVTTKYGTKYETSQYAQGYIVQPKAVGSEMYPDRTYYLDRPQAECLKNRVSEISGAPQRHFDKWVSDLKAITDAGIMVDPSKLSNFFYDKKQGFSFIDLNFMQPPLFTEPDLLGNESHRSFINYSMLPALSYCLQEGLNGKKVFSDEEFEQMKIDTAQTFLKISSSLQKVGVSEEDIKQSFEEQRTNNGGSSGISIFGMHSYDEVMQFCEDNNLLQESEPLQPLGIETEQDTNPELDTTFLESNNENLEPTSQTIKTEPQIPEDDLPIQ